MKKLFLLLSILTLFIFISCGKSEKEYFESGNKFLSENKISDAISNYEKLIEKYPNSTYATEALYRLGNIYQNKLVPNISNEEAMKKAISYYEKIIAQNKKDKFAPKALFMIGFIQANELKNYDEATKTYKKFLSDYPDNELTKAAQDELDYMGLSPEEIIAKKNISNK